MRPTPYVKPAAFLLTLVLTAGAIGGAAGPAVAAPGDAPTGAVATPPSDTYVVEQGDNCRPVEPLSTDQSVEAFYDYRDHDTHPEGVDRMYSSYGTTHLQESDTSLLFLHEGTDGVSLVVVHDELDGGTPGGVVTFEYVGVPHDAEWVVRNDDYGGDTNRDEFEVGDGWARASWAYVENRTGGGALRGGFGDPFAVTVHPAFNEDADLYDPEVAAEFDDENATATGTDWWDGGELENWVVLSGDADDPDRFDVPSLDEPVTVRTGTCDTPSITYERTDDGIAATVTDPRPGDVVPLQPTAGTGEGVRFERVDVTGLSEDATVEFASAAPPTGSDPPPEADPLSQLTVRGSESVDAGDVAGRVTVTVDADRLADGGTGPDDVVLYESDGATWTAVSVDRYDRAGSYRYVAEVSSLEGVTVAVDPAAGSDVGTWYSRVGVAGAVAVGTLLALSILWVVAARRR